MTVGQNMERNLSYGQNYTSTKTHSDQWSEILETSRRAGPRKEGRVKNRFGPYTELRTRSDGRVRIRFAVPPRHRPPGWPAMRPVFLEGEDGIDLETLTPAQEAELQRQVGDYYIELCKVRAGFGLAAPDDAQQPKPPTSAWTKVLEVRRSSQLWQDKKERTKKNYINDQRRLMDVVSQYGLDIATSTQSQFEAAISKAISSKWVRSKLYSELRCLVGHAIREGLRAPHLAFITTIKTPHTKVQLWTERDVASLVVEMLRWDERGLAKLILTQWEIGQRLADVRNLRYGHHYQDGVFSFRCRKTDAPIRLEVQDPSARRILDRDFRYGDYMFRSARTGQPFDENQIAGRFYYIRSRTPNYKDSKLQLRCLRHTVIVEFARAGCTIPLIGSVTGHSMNHIHKTLEYYMSRDQRLVAQALAKRKKMRIGDVDGEMLIEGARRLWIGDQAKTARPMSPKELALYGPA